MYRSEPPDPSAPSSNPMNPPDSTRSSTTAPTPSPKTMQVERSVQSTIFDSRSPPTTSAQRAKPLASIEYAWAGAYMKPVQPAERAYAAASLLPSASASTAAGAGKAMSGVTVAQI